MDQELLDTARYKMTNMSLDSRFADKYYADTADYQMRLPSLHRNIMRLALTSVEIPAVEWVFSAEHGNLDFQYKVSPATTFTTVSIAPGNYTIDELKTAIDTALPAAFTVTVDPNTHLMKISNPSAFTLNLYSGDDRIASRRTHWGIGYYMGFRDKTVTSSGSGPYTVTGLSPVSVLGSPYYLLQLEVPSPVEPLRHRLLGNGWIGAFAKLILRNGVYTIDYDDGGNMLRKENTFLAPVSIQTVRVRIVDAFGEVVNLHYTDWSLTLELYEVVNSRVYSAISETFQRT